MHSEGRRDLLKHLNVMNALKIMAVNRLTDGIPVYRRRTEKMGSKTERTVQGLEVKITNSFS